MAGPGGVPRSIVSEAQAAAEAAAQAIMPKPATTLPAAAGTKSVTGTETTRYALEDHTHEVRARRARVTLGANGSAVWKFDRPFATRPGIWCQWEDDGGRPVYAFPVKGSWTQDAAGQWTGVTIRGQRQQVLPAINLLASVAGFDVFGGSAAGCVIACMAGEDTPT
ncbi:hypothetical protein J2X36_002141 [Methylobacterium sp. BE186]|uniref:hypothetical protein n=1 Tax=Methylobacterium sp. BE186 TaxID=2817715 RepID=UPI002857C794|nr:hypothetical protein [Methylobacterium sp. BE186]MDR7037394.1 hypothetical protein [Methylobacterium sp. BE186]